MLVVLVLCFINIILACKNNKKPKNPLLSKYKKIKELGKGGYARVDLYEDKKDHTKWAIKKVNLTGLDESEYKNAMGEPLILKDLEHPNIISMRQIGESPEYTIVDEVLYIVLEYAKCKFNE